MSTIITSGIQEEVVAPVLRVVSREEWGASAPGPLEPLPHPIHYVKMSLFRQFSERCSTPEECAGLVRRAQSMDMEQNHPDINANFVITCDGRVYEGRGWNHKPETRPKYEQYEDCLDILYVGKFEYSGQPVGPYLWRCRDILKYALFNKYLGVDFEIIDYGRYWFEEADELED